MNNTMNNIPSIVKLLKDKRKPEMPTYIIGIVIEYHTDLIKISLNHQIRMFQYFWKSTRRIEKCSDGYIIISRQTCGYYEKNIIHDEKGKVQIETYVSRRPF